MCLLYKQHYNRRLIAVRIERSNLKVHNLPSASQKISITNRRQDFAHFTTTCSSLHSSQSSLAQSDLHHPKASLQWPGAT